MLPLGVKLDFGHVFPGIEFNFLGLWILDKTFAKKIRIEDGNTHC